MALKRRIDCARVVKAEPVDAPVSNAESLEGSSPSPGTKPPYEGPGEILGGLPVYAKLYACRDYFGEVDVQVVSIHWVDKDGNPRGEISQKVYDKAEEYDPYFSDLIYQVDEHLSYLQWMAEAPIRERKEQRAREARLRRVQHVTRRRKRVLTL